MWFPGPCGIHRGEEKEISFSHCFPFTSDHCSPAAPDLSAPMVGEAERFMWSKAWQSYYPIYRPYQVLPNLMSIQPLYFPQALGACRLWQEMSCSFQVLSSRALPLCSPSYFHQLPQCTYRCLHYFSRVSEQVFHWHVW